MSVGLDGHIISDVGFPPREIGNNEVSVAKTKKRKIFFALGFRNCFICWLS